MREETSGARRRYSAEFKSQILGECARAGASIAKVALSHGINANLIHKWRCRGTADTARKLVGTAPANPFIALPMPAAADADIRIELRRGATLVSVQWPSSAAPACAQWLRELLK